MRITITKGGRADEIEAVRADGRTARASFPHKGPVPHDAVHFHVESTLAMPDAFWGMVARGSDPEELAAIAKAGGHASATRPAIPQDEIIPLVQAERTVECFEADLWSGSAGDPQSIREMIAAGCAQSLVPRIAASDESIVSIQSTLRDLSARWSGAPVGDRLILEWPEPAA